MLAKAPNIKRAIEYLAACGAVPIAIIERDGLCSIHAGQIAGTVAARWWISERIAPRVAAQARRLADVSPDVSPATAALHRSAASLGLTLTADDVAAELIHLDDVPAARRLPRFLSDKIQLVFGMGTDALTFNAVGMSAWPAPLVNHHRRPQPVPPRTSLIMSSSTTAPIVALTIALMMPAPR
jgi:hypothetical protein